MCGGTPSLGRGRRECGLSPRVRGNRSVGRLYALPPARWGWGLSPRVRGNRSGDIRPCGWRLVGSIPACAGEPASWMASARRAQRVYPRVCGGTHCLKLLRRSDRGVYPRVCGGTHLPGRPAARRGSIPACAGEPSRLGKDVATRGTPAAVYPRVCGGTILGARCRPVAHGGLSPRVRGNPALERHHARFPRHGSIPACAGETRLTGKELGGNKRGAGSIPACAGEPVQAYLNQPRRAVYPRVCGGTPPVYPPEPTGRQ